MLKKCIFVTDSSIRKGDLIETGDCSDNRGDIFSRFTSNSEAKASELLENLEKKNLLQYCVPVKKSNHTLTCYPSGKG